jgi:hypothetical protein
MGDQKFYYLDLLRASEGTLSLLSRLYLRLLAPTNPQWARAVGYGLFSLYVIHKEGLCPSSGEINRLIMMKVSIFLIIFCISLYSRFKNRPNMTFDDAAVEPDQVFELQVDCQGVLEYATK